MDRSGDAGRKFRNHSKTNRSNNSSWTNIPIASSWPAASAAASGQKPRQSKPKQFLDILGTGKSFIRMTYERFEKLAPAENFLVVTNARYKDLVLEQIPELGPEQVLCEPVGRNTAPCICYAA